MRPLFRPPVKKNPDEFHLVELLYLPDTLQDWIILFILTLIGVGAYFVIIETLSVNKAQIETNQDRATKLVLSEIQRTESLSFEHYLIGTWQTFDGRYVSIDFLSPHRLILSLYGKGVSKPITETYTFHVKRSNPQLGTLKFCNEQDPKEQGTIAKVWNRDAIEITYSKWKKPMLLYFDLLDLNSKRINSHG